MGRLTRIDDGLPPLTSRVHYASLYPEDITTVDGVPVTAPARTLLDIATEISREKLAEAVATALERGLTTGDGIREVIVRYPDHPGGRRLLSLRPSGKVWTRV